MSADEAFNFVAQGAQKGLDKNGEFLDILREYSPHFKSLGFDAEEMLSILKNGLDDGAFSLDQLSDGMKEFNIKAIDGSKTTIEAFKALNMDADEMADTFAAGGDKANEAFFKVVESIKAVKDPIKQNEIAVGLFGTKFEDLEAGMLSTVSEIGGGFDRLKDTVEGINEVKYDTFGEALQGLRRGFETSILIPIGQLILPILNKLLQIFVRVRGVIAAELAPVLDTIKKKLFDAFAGNAPDIDKFVDLFISKIPGAIDVWRTMVIPILDNIIAIFKNIISSITPEMRNGFIAMLKTEIPILAEKFKQFSGKVTDVFDSFREFFSLIFSLFIFSIVFLLLFNRLSFSFTFSSSSFSLLIFQFVF